MTDTGDRTGQNEESDAWLASALWNFELACESIEQDDDVLVKEFTAQGLDRLSNINQEATA